MKRFTAPWGTLLVVLSAGLTVLCIGITGVLWVPFEATQPGNPAFWLRLAPIGLVFGCALFSIRGYTLAADMLQVRRMLWSTWIPLAGLRSAEYRPRAMWGSIRLFGNGGFYSFSGIYRNRALGRYRAYVTDLRKTVILRFEKRVVVISPGDPERFVREVSAGIELGR